MDLFLSAGFLPTITKPTRITHCTATLIDNIYIKTSKQIKLASGIILSNISDHLPVLLFSEKYKSMKTGKWSDMLFNIIPVAKLISLLVLMYILSINVAVLCVILVGFVIVGKNPALRKRSNNSETCA